MSDIRDKAKEDRNWLERMMDKVLGFRGYRQQDERRETDKILRTHLADRLDGLRSNLDPMMRDLTNSGGLMVVGEVDRVKKTLEGLANRIRYMSYGYTGMFAAVKIEEPELDKLYNFDSALVDRIDELQEIQQDLLSTVSDHDRLKSEVNRTLGVIREFEEHLDRRSRMLTEVP